MIKHVTYNKHYIPTPAQELAHAQALARAEAWIAKRKAAKLPINPFSDRIAKAK